MTTEHVAGGSGAGSEPHRPSSMCVDTCDNPYVCRDEWDRWAGEHIDQFRADLEVARGEIADRERTAKDLAKMCAGVVEDLAQARARIAKALKPHKPDRYAGTSEKYCVECTRGWPCPTVQALDAAQAAESTQGPLNRDSDASATKQVHTPTESDAHAEDAQGCSF